MADFNWIFEKNSVKPPELSVYKGRLKSKKQPAQLVFLAEPLIPTATRPLSPRERVRERATSRKACIWVVRVLGKIAAIWRMPSPTGEGAGYSGFRRYRSSEKKNARNINSRNFSGSLLLQGR